MIICLIVSTSLSVKSESLLKIQIQPPCTGYGFKKMRGGGFALCLLVRGYGKIEQTQNYKITGWQNYFLLVIPFVVIYW